MNTQSNPFDEPWLIVDNQAISGELITLNAGEIKYVLVFSIPEYAAVFIKDLNDPSLQLVTLENWVLKDAFLTAAKLLGATRVMFDYIKGQHLAQSAPLEKLIEYLKSRIGT